MDADPYTKGSLKIKMERRRLVAKNAHPFQAAYPFQAAF